MGVDWTQLPAELLESISKNLKIYADYVRFRAVCRNWRSAVPKIPLDLPPQLPWLVLPPTRSHLTYRAIFDLSTDKLHHLSLPEYSTNPAKRHRGSSEGWLVILDLSPDIILLNPLSRAKVHLPPLSTFPKVTGFNYSHISNEYELQCPYRIRYNRSLQYMRDCFIKKVVLSSSPSKDPNFVAMAIINETMDLAYCRSGSDSWSIIEAAHSFSEDVIYFQGLFYAVNIDGEIAVCDVSGASPQVSFIRTWPLLAVGGDIRYLVGSGDELFLITRHLALEFDDTGLYGHNSGYRTRKFDVFRLDWSVLVWKEVRSLGDEALYIGGNSSLSLQASDFPGCVGNRIYYTDDYSENNFHDGACTGDDMGIYNLGDGSIKPLPSFFFYTLQWPPPVWITPNPC
ncbi:hypothetical protein SLEP1_g50511 [Rubroshorea leprosula]|uniref:F-box domain-containing protein n=1 Tax=Rubroshorea leprosula TaxID=152421 RepID=A0AAV5M096_9ROSI|nr:hypothetical protein SLEP1_g50511 [Rubroshorea leprosula]